VLAATLPLAAEEEPAGLHMEAIARRAGVSKETLYRWWHSKTEVVLDALADLSQLLERGAVRGEISRDRAALATDFVYGSMWYRLIFRVGPLDYRWADEVADAIASW
jgi:AcrR family transcriptional regulator